MGIVQGLTEFLPVSSSGHLILVPYLFGWDDPFINSLAFQRDAPHGHARSRCWSTSATTGSAWSRPGSRRSATARSGTTRTASSPGCSSSPRSRPPIAGFLFNDVIETRSGRPGLVAVMLVVGAAILWLADRWGRAARKASRTSPSRSRSGIGVAQALALIPGISRSGISISAGLFAGLDREAAARFSFLMATPITAGAGVFEACKLVDRRGRRGGRAAPLAGRARRGARRPACSRSAFLLRYLRTRSLDIFVVVPARRSRRSSSSSSGSSGR